MSVTIHRSHYTTNAEHCQLFSMRFRKYFLIDGGSNRFSRYPYKVRRQRSYLRRTSDLHRHSPQNIFANKHLRSSFSRRICPTADFQRYHNGKRFHSKDIYIVSHNFRKVKHFFNIFLKRRAHHKRHAHLPPHSSAGSFRKP